MIARLLAAAALAVGIPAPARPAPPAPISLTVAMVPGFSWERSPSAEVRAVLGDSPVGALVLTTARRHLCAADVWLTFGALDPAYVPGPGCPNATVTGRAVDGWQDIVRANARKHYGARLGIQGERERCIGATGANAALAAAREDGTVAEYATTFGVNGLCTVQYADLTDAPSFTAAVATVRAAYRATTTILIGLPAEGAHYGAVAFLGDPKPGLLEGRAHRRGIVLSSDFAPLTWAMRGDDAVRGDARFAYLVDLDRAGHLHHRYAGVYFTALIALPLLLYIWVSIRRRAGPKERAVAYVLAAFPAAGFLCSLVPWWRADPAWIACAAACALAAVFVAVVARLLPGPPGPVLAALVAAVFTVDVAVGAPLQRSGLASYSALNGGRFYGLGNVGFAVLATAAVVALCWVARARGQRVWLLGLLPVALLDASSRFGADLGGAVGLLAALGAAFARRARKTALALGAAAGLALAAGAAWLDYRRPPGNRTHLGTFVDDLRHGRWSDTVHRKVDANLHALTRSWFPLLLVGSVAVAVLMLRRLRAAGDETVRPLVVPLVALWVVGSLVNDSGIVIAAVGLAVAVPLLLAYASERLDDRPW